MWLYLSSQSPSRFDILFSMLDIAAVSLRHCSVVVNAVSQRTLESGQFRPSCQNEGGHQNLRI